MELEGTLPCSQQLSTTYCLDKIHFTTNLLSMFTSPNSTYFRVFRKKLYAFKCLLGHAVAQSVAALSYKPEGRGFDSQ
jgi:hypothetical protein